MPINLHVRRRLTNVVISMALTGPLLAQSAPLGPQRPSPEISFTLLYRQLDFRYVGAESTKKSLDFDHPVYGFRLTFPQWRGLGTMTLVLGGQGPGADSVHPALRFFDIEFTAWSRYRLLGRRRTQLDGALTAVVAYRRLGGVEIPHAGGGVGFLVGARLSPRLVLDMRSGGYADFVMKSPNPKGLALGLSWIWDSDVALRLERGAHRFGVTVGAGLRFGRWRIAAAERFPGSQSKWFTYHSSETTLRLGISK